MYESKALHPFLADASRLGKAPAKQWAQLHDRQTVSGQHSDNSRWGTGVRAAIHRSELGRNSRESSPTFASQQVALHMTQ